MKKKKKKKKKEEQVESETTECPEALAMTASTVKNILQETLKQMLLTLNQSFGITTEGIPTKKDF